MRLLSALLIGLATVFLPGCGGSSSYKAREADPNVNDEVLVDDPAMSPAGATTANTKK